MSNIVLGWIKLKKYCELSGETEDAIKQRIFSSNYPEWRVGGFVKLLRNGYWLNYEGVQEWLQNQPDNYRVA